MPKRESLMLKVRVLLSLVAITVFIAVALDQKKNCRGIEQYGRESVAGGDPLFLECYRFCAP